MLTDGHINLSGSCAEVTAISRMGAMRPCWWLCSSGCLITRHCSKKYPSPPGPSAWLENVGHFRTAQDGFGNDTKLENDRHLHHLQGCVPKRIDHFPGEQPGSRHNVAPREYATLCDPDTLVREPKVVPRRKERTTFNGQAVRHLVRTSRLSIPIPGGQRR